MSVHTECKVSIIRVIVRVFNTRRTFQIIGCACVCEVVEFLEHVRIMTEAKKIENCISPTKISSLINLKEI